MFLLWLNWFDFVPLFLLCLPKLFFWLRSFLAASVDEILIEGQKLNPLAWCFLYIEFYDQSRNLNPLLFIHRFFFQIDVGMVNKVNLKHYFRILFSVDFWNIYQDRLLSSTDS